MILFLTSLILIVSLPSFPGSGDELFTITGNDQIKLGGGTILVETSELILLLMGIGVIVFVLINFDRLRSLPHMGTLLLAIFALLLSWIVTVLEGFFLSNFLNLVEHSLYALASLFAMVWAWFVYGKGCAR